MSTKGVYMAEKQNRDRGNVQDSVQDVELSELQRRETAGDKRQDGVWHLDLESMVSLNAYLQERVTGRPRPGFQKTVAELYQTVIQPGPADSVVPSTGVDTEGATPLPRADGDEEHEETAEEFVERMWRKEGA